MISIVMIVYDVERYVEQGIKSVLSQTYSDIELIIVASEGHDRSVDICRQYAKTDDRIKLIIAPPNGIADARNRGLAQVRGDYLGFVDPDDYIEPQMYERLIGHMEKYGADIAVCGRFYEYVNATLSDKAGEVKVMTGSGAVAMTLGNEGFFLHCWDKLYSGKIFKDLHFRTDITVEDRIVVDRLLSAADTVVYDPEPMYHFRERSGSSSKKSGMVRNNVEANLLMEEFIRSEHPELKDECTRFMLYEMITAIQNELVSPLPSKADLKDYTDKVRSLAATPCPLVGRSLRLKSFAAIYLKPILKLYTKVRQTNSANTLERFP